VQQEQARVGLIKIRLVAWYTRRVIRRYLLPCVLIMAVSVGAAEIAYASSRKTQFSASCSFQALVHLSQAQPQSADFLDFYNRLAANEVSIAVASNPYAAVAKRERVDAGKLADSTTVQPIPGLGLYGLRVIAAESRAALVEANGLCDQIVKSIIKHRADDNASQIKDLNARIKTLQTELKRITVIPPAKRTTVQSATLQAQEQALSGNAAQIAGILSLPPDSISVLIRAVNAQGYDPRSQSKNLLIALVGGLLACFLVVLLGEVIAERRAGAREGGV